MTDTERLPRVEAVFNVLAPPGGFRRRLRSLDLGHWDHLDVEIEDPGYGIRMWLRVIPNRDEAILHPKHSEVYIFNAATAIFIDEENGNELPKRPVVDVWVSINTAVQIAGMPAGTLKYWEHYPETNEIGA